MAPSMDAPGRSHRGHPWLHRAALSAVVLVFAAGALHGVADYWQWGHDGYNGAAFSQAARNSLRFGIVGQAQYHTGLDAPAAEAIYTHHPMLVHLHLVAAQAALGSAEWVGRATPVLYSIAALIMLYLLVARFADRWSALATAAVFVLTPLHVVFAKMVSHEQGAIFWLLAFFHAYLAWLDRCSRRAFALALVCITAAAQFDWPAYYVAFFVAVHGLKQALEAGNVGGPLWNRHVRFVVAHSAVVLANFAAFFGWIYRTRGTLDEMGAAYAGRAAGGARSAAVQLERLLELQGPFVLALFAAGAAMAVLRARRGRASPLDTVVAAFLFAQLVHWVAFPGAAYHHSYWTYYLGPALAIAGGTSIAATMRAAARRGRRILAAAAVGLAAFVVAAGVFAWRQVRWAERTGHAAYRDDYDDQIDEIRVAREVAERFARPKAVYVVDPSIRRRRIELDYYLDGPIRTDLRKPLAEELASRVEHRVLLLDLDHFDADPAYRAYVERLAETRRAIVWDRRFVAIDVSSDTPSLESFVSEAQPPSLLWCWLVSLDHPPIRWVPDDDSAAARARLERALGSGA